jgi:hypothetical protein
MRPLVLLAALSACGGEREPQSDASPLASHHDAAVSPESHHDAGAAPAAPDLAVALPQHCPCPLGSYCDLATNACKKGCLGDDHCPTTQRCDTTIFQCADTCMTATDCANHRDCQPLANAKICKGCVDGFDDCNKNPDDGCETPLDTVTDCHKCGKAATTTCLTDVDYDGYGVAGTDRIECECQSGEIEPGRGADCDDNNQAVHPGQTDYFAMPRANGSFDYDCDGKETPEHDLLVGGKSCDFTCASDVWLGQKPACGTLKASAFECFYDANIDECESATITFDQLCR